MSVLCSAANIICKTPYDGARIIVSVVALIAGAASLIYDCQALGWLTILLIDAYVAFIIVCTAVASSVETISKDERNNAIAKFPSRPAALIIVPVFLGALVLAFASLYIGEPHVLGQLSPKLTAIYFSAERMMDFGDGPDIASLHHHFTVLMHHLSAFIILLAAIPLLVGRLAVWEQTS